MNYIITFRSKKSIFKDLSKIPENNIRNILLKIRHLSKEGLNNRQIKRLNNYNLCDYRLRV
jgi:hypothetical protein